MKSQLLESIGLGNIDIAYIMIGLLILILILFILLIVSMVKQSKLKNDMKHLCRVVMHRVWKVR